MEDRSLWHATAPHFPHPSFDGDLTVDTAIVGGGITGVTAAMLLSEAGQSVALIEANEIGSGTTGNSTGNLYATVGAGLFHLADQWDEETLRAVVRSRAFAVDLVEQTIRRLSIECAFARRSWHLFAMPGMQAQQKTLEKEHAAALRAGLPAQLLLRAPLSFQTGSALVIEGQAQFNPAAYVQGLAQAIASRRCQIFEHSPVRNIDSDRRILETGRGRITAQNIFVATHVPKGFDIVQTELGPYREYAVAATLRSGDYPEGIFWSAEEETHSIRSHTANGSRYVVVVGQHHSSAIRKDATSASRRFCAPTSPSTRLPTAGPRRVTTRQTTFRT
jgi:glycine/D-amino acid oxidase-like deaminating enzyme